MAEEILENANVNEEVVSENKPAEKKFTGKKPFNKKANGDRRARREENDGFEKKTLQINRVTKVVKGGRNLRFAALVVVGDKNGKVGVGTGKAAETPNAIDKATASAKKNLITVNLLNGTIPHEVIGKFGTSKVLLMPAPEGTGVIAGGSARTVLELVGVKNITCKNYGSRNSINNVRATIDALTRLNTREQIALKRGKKPEEI